MQRHEYLYNPQKRKKNSHDKTIETVQKSQEEKKKKKRRRKKILENRFTNRSGSVNRDRSSPRYPSSQRGLDNQFSDKSPPNEVVRLTS